MNSANDSFGGLEVKLTFVDVGFGDCTILLDRRGNRAMVMDCPPWGVEAAVSALEGAFLDTVIVSHLDLDHYGGIVEVVRRAGGCREIKMAPIVSLNSRGEIKIRAFVREIARYLRSGSSGHGICAGEHGELGPARWRCLSPGLLESLEALNTSNNRASVVIRIDLDGLGILIGSDADAVVWRELIDRSAGELRSDILRYPHHGAPLVGAVGKASLNEVLSVVSPSIVVLSIGERMRYGHPALGVIAGLISASCRVMCTRSTALCNNGTRSDEACAGSVTIGWSPEGWSISPSHAAHEKVIELLPTPACRR